MTDRKLCLYDQHCYVLPLLAMPSAAVSNLLLIPCFVSRFLFQVQREFVVAVAILEQVLGTDRCEVLRERLCVDALTYAVQISLSSVLSFLPGQKLGRTYQHVHH